MTQIKKLTELRELSMLEPHSRPAASVVTSLIGLNQHEARDQGKRRENQDVS